jgi:hypothetical protein
MLGFLVWACALETARANNEKARVATGTHHFQHREEFIAFIVYLSLFVSPRRKQVSARARGESERDCHPANECRFEL